MKNCTEHYEDNQGYCHNCGMPIWGDAYLGERLGWSSTSEDVAKVRDEFDAELKRWSER